MNKNLFKFMQLIVLLIVIASCSQKAYVDSLYRVPDIADDKQDSYIVQVCDMRTLDIDFKLKVND